MNTPVTINSRLSEQANRLRFGTAGRFALPVVTVIWGGLVGLGLFWMWQYEVTPGADLSSPRWPNNTQCELDPTRPTLLMFAHPRCPCTRASIGELSEFVARCPGKVDVRVVFLKPSGSSKDWERTDLWQTASAIPGVTVLQDLDGAEAEKFGATTSGYALLYTPDARLLFAGGITSARGHSGDNAGRSMLESLVMHEAPNAKGQHESFLAFGCPLRNDAEVCVTECQE